MPFALRSLGQVELSLGDREAALRHLTRAAELRPDDGAAFAALARLYLQLDDVERAEAASRRAQRLRPVEAFDDPQRGLKSGAILVLVGAVNLPIIKFSVDWWRTLHQPASVSHFARPELPASMLLPLLVMTVAFAALGLSLSLLRTRAEIAERRIRTLQMAQAAAAD